MGRYDSDDEQKEAEDRIARIRGGGSSGSQSTEPGEGSPSRSGGDPFGDTESEALSRARSRGRGIRTGDVESPSSSRASSRGSMGEDVSAEPQPSRRTSSGPNPLVIIGGVVGAGLIIVLLIVLASWFFNPNAANPLVPATETPTPTATPTETPVPPTPTPSPTPEPPDLEVPNLECIFNRNVGGCFDYCNDPANADQCQGARNFIDAQGADPDVFFQCLSPSSGANVGNAQQCLDEAWIANN